jgi:protein-disulfide isomerase
MSFDRADFRKRRSAVLQVGTPAPRVLFAGQVRRQAMSVLRVPVSDRDHVRGPRDARVTLVEYGDYACPSCGAAYLMVEDLQEECDDQMRFVYRHFPLTETHAHAEIAAEASEAAGAQGKFWAMHDVLLTHQDSLGEDSVIQYCVSLRLDVMWFRRALRSHMFAKRIREDVISGARSGVNGTPTFFINNVRYEGPHEYSAMVAAIQEAGRSRVA